MKATLAILAIVTGLLLTCLYKILAFLTRELIKPENGDARDSKDED